MFQKLSSWAFLIVCLTVSACVVAAEGGAPQPDDSHWGIATSSSGLKNYGEWLPKMSAIGVRWVRWFPEWNGVEPTQGNFKWERTDALMKISAENNVQVNAVLMGSIPWSKEKTHMFPVSNLEAWSGFVSAAVDRYKAQVHYWEVWNEGNGGFNAGHHTTTDYANLVAATYAAAKKSDPNAKVGLTVASYDAPYLKQTILALDKIGKPNSFDYLCIHPYEIADGINEPNGEVPFLWMTKTLRGVLKQHAPERENAEIWITEVGHRIEKRKDHEVKEEEVAKALVKMYTMAIAQGIRHTQWFEAQDPVGEEDGFGLIKRDGKTRATHEAFKRLATVLGPTLKYLGWVALGSTGRGYGFVFQGSPAISLVAWMPAGEVDKSLKFKSDVQMADAVTGSLSNLSAGQPLNLSDSPVFIWNVEEWRAEAQANVNKSFPWGGDYSTAKSVSIQLGEQNGDKGLSKQSSRSTLILTFPDGSKGAYFQGSQSANFFVHPSFASFNTSDYHIRLTVRRVGPGNAGMNLNYEVADSKGQNAYKNRGEWFSLTDATGWQTHTWHVTDACFSKMWGYDFCFRPENGAPFVIGKVEVSTEPFQ